jgi:hypothetical protein
LFVPLLVTLTILAAAIIFVLSWLSAEAHQAPSGWEYPPGCCNGAKNECHPAVILETDKGYVVVEASVLVPFGDARIKPSGDSEWHVCDTFNPNYGWSVHCVYIPLSARLLVPDGALADMKWMYVIVFIWPDGTAVTMFSKIPFPTKAKCEAQVVMMLADAANYGNPIATWECKDMVPGEGA